MDSPLLDSWLAMFALVVVIVIVTLLTQVEPERTRILDWGLEVVISVQDTSHVVNILMRIFSALGNVAFYVTLVPILFLTTQHQFALRFCILIISNSYINAFLKEAFHEPRPTWYSTKVIGELCEDEYGSPSGHAQAASSMYTFLAYILLKWGSNKWRQIGEEDKSWLVGLVSAGLLGCAGMIVGTSVSRIYLQAHFPHQVLLGVLVGFLVTAMHVRVFESVAGLAITGQLLPNLGAVCSALQAMMLGFAAAVYLITHFTWTIPQEWKDTNHINCPGNNIDPYASLHDLTLAAGLGPTLLIAQGIRTLHLQDWDGEWGGFSSIALCAEKMTRAAIAVVATIIIFVGMDLMVPEEAPLMLHLMFGGFFRGIAVIIVLLICVPWLCMELKLLRPNGVPFSEGLLQYV